MSGVGSVVNIATANVYDAQGASFSVQHNGSVYRSAPAAASDGETQSLLIDAYGRLEVINTSTTPLYVQGIDADNAAASSNPVPSGGIYESALPTYDDGDIGRIHIDSSGRQIVNDDQLLTAFNSEDFATQTTLNALLTAFNAEDFATQTTLATIAAVDFATQTTLAALLTAFNSEDFATQTTLDALLTAFNAEDFATQTTLDSLLTAFNAEDFASETTLSSLNDKILDSEISTNNSTTTPLSGGASWVGTSEEIYKYSSITVAIETDEDSAADGLDIEFSTDNSNWFTSHSFTITGGERFTCQELPEARYFRLNYTNGGTAQTYFRVQVIKHFNSIELHQPPLSESMGDNEPAQLVRAVLAGKTPGGSYQNIDITNGGNLKVSVEETISPSGTVKQAALTVGTSAVRCTHDASAPSDTRKYLCVNPDGETATGRFYVGSSSVAISGANRGVEVFPGEKWERFDDAGDYYIISDTAAQTVFVTEQE